MRDFFTTKSRPKGCYFQIFGNKIQLLSFFQLQQNQSMDKADKFSTEVKMLRSENALLQDELRRAKVPSIYYDYNLMVT